ncbi:MAG: ATP-binding cassette domain-containing protein [bacterium]
MQIICKNMTIGYDSKVVMKDLNFNINEGDYLLIIGENGAGKSTLVKTLLSLIPILDGEFVLTGGVQKNEIGYLPQQSDYQKDFPATVFEVVVSGCLNKSKISPFYTKEEKNKALTSIEKLGILNLRNECFKNLSGGQRQRVLIARAFCATSKILLLDEPVSGLDPETTSELYKLINDLNKEITIIMISHDVDVSVSYASHVLALGKNYFFGTKQDYLKFKNNNNNNNNF